MTIENETDLQGILRIGQICGAALQHMLAHVEPGMTTAELDAIGAAFLKEQGARSAPILAYRFPGWTCISINEEAAHGIPGERVIRPGDVVNVDVSAELEGFGRHGGDGDRPPADPEDERLCAFTRRAWEGHRRGAGGAPMNAIAGRSRTWRARRLPPHPVAAGHGVGAHPREPSSKLLSQARPHRIEEGWSSPSSRSSAGAVGASAPIPTLDADDGRSQHLRAVRHTM